MFFKFKNPSPKKEQQNRHFIFIEALVEIISPEITLWGEASWWPKKSSMKFTRLTDQPVGVKTKYRQEVLLPLAPKWEAEVTRLIPNKEIERTFLNGMFKGKETVSLEERYNGTKVEYLMQYEVVGIFNKILWKLFFRKMHDQNIEMIFHALKEDIAKKMEQK